MKSLLLISIILFSASVYGQKTSEGNKSKAKTEVNTVDQKYTELIKIADAAYAQSDYVKAKEYYNQAVAIKPKEAYAKDMLSKTQHHLDEQSNDEIEAQYAKIIAAADKYFAEKNYLKAKGYYERAVMFRPSDPYPKNKLAEVEALLAAEQKAKDAQADKKATINRLTKEGDALFASKKYPEANIKYNQVLVLDATAMYPKQKISEIQSILATSDTEPQYEKMKNDSIMRIADSLFAYKQYVDAKAKYTEVLTIKPTDIHCKERVTEIDKILAIQQNEYQKKMEYNALMVQAQRQMDLKEYEKAKASYEKAHALEPVATLPITRIAEIEAIMKENK